MHRRPCISARVPLIPSKPWRVLIGGMIQAGPDLIVGIQAGMTTPPLHSSMIQTWPHLIGGIQAGMTAPPSHSSMIQTGPDLIGGIQAGMTAPPLHSRLELFSVITALEDLPNSKETAAERGLDNVAATQSEVAATPRKDHLVHY